MNVQLACSEVGSPQPSGAQPLWFLKHNSGLSLLQNSDLKKGTQQHLGYDPDPEC